MDNEVRILNKLKNCEFVPKLIRAYKNNEAYVLITEFIDGKHVPLYQVPKNEKSKYELAIRAIHAHGILHGDIKADNFVMTKDKVYVIDFGFSKKATQSQLDAEYNILREMLGLPQLIGDSGDM